MEIEQESQTKPSYSNYQKFVSQNLPLLPKKIQNISKECEHKLQASLRQLNGRIQNSELYKNIDNWEQDPVKYRPIYKMIIQSLHLSSLLETNFKVDLGLEEIETSLILGFKALSTCNLDLNMANRISTSLSNFSQHYMKLERLTQFAHEQRLWEKFYDYLKSDFQNHSTFLVGKLLVTKFMSNCKGVLTNWCKIFRLDFSEIYARMRNDKVKFFDISTTKEETWISMWHFIDVAHLAPKDLYVVLKDFNFTIGIIKPDPKLILKIFSKLSYNENFKMSQQTFRIVKPAIFNISTSISNKNVKSDKIYFAKLVSKIFGNFLIRKGNTLEDTETMIDFIEQTVDCYVDTFHPKARTHNGDWILRKAISNFVQIYHRRINNERDQEIKQTIENFFEKLMKRVLTFGLYRDNWTDMHQIVQTLGAIDAQKFIPFVIERIQLGLTVDEFSKYHLYNYVHNITKYVCEDESMTENLYWIVPKMLERLENTSDSGEVNIILQNLSNIYEFFIDADTSDVTKEFPHLEEYKDDIDESAIKVFNYFIKKGKDFSSSAENLKTILSLGSYVSSKIFDRFQSEFQNIYDSLNSGNLQSLIVALMYKNPEKTQEVVVDWMNRKVWRKAKEPRALESFKIGKILEKFGIETVDYELRSTNDTVIKKEIAVVSSISRKALLLSQETLLTTLKYYAICLDHKENSVVQVATNASTLYLQNLTFSYNGITNRAYLKQSLREQKDTFKYIQHIFPEEDQPQRVKELFSNVLLTTFEITEDYMKKIAKVETLEETEYDQSLIDIYRQSIKQEGQDENLDHLNNALIDDFCDVIQILNASVIYNVFSYEIFRSKKFATFLEKFKKRLVTFLNISKLYELDKVRSCALFILTQEAFTIKNLYDLNYALPSIVGKTFSFTSTTLFKELPTRKQFNSAYGVGKNIMRIWRILEGSSGSLAPIFEQVCGENSYTSSQNLQDFALVTSTEENFYYFGDLAYDYLIQNAVKKAFYQIAPIALRHNAEDNGYKFLDTFFHTGPFFFEEDINQRSYATAIEHLQLKCSIDTDYDDIVSRVAFKIINYFTYQIKNEGEKQLYITMLRLIAENGNNNKNFGKFKNIITLLVDMAPIFEVNENTKKEFLSFITGMGDSVQNQSAISFFITATEYLTTIGSYENDLEVLQQAILTFSFNLAVKDLRKRVILSVLLIFTQEMADRHSQQEERVVVSCDSLANEEGILAPEMIAEVYSEVRHRLGYRQEGSSNPQVKETLKELDNQLIPCFSEAYQGAPLVFIKIVKDESKRLNFDDEQVQQAIQTYTAYIKALIDEAQNMKDKDYNSLSINQNIIKDYIIFKSHLRDSLKKTTLIFRMVTSSILRNFGISVYNAVKPIFKELKEEKSDNVTSIQRFEQEFYSVALDIASQVYTDEEFGQIAEEVIDIFRGYMNPMFRKIQTTSLIRLTYGTYNATSQQIQQVFGLLHQAYSKVTDPECKCMMLSLYVSLLTSSNAMFDEQTEKILQNAITNTELTSLNNYTEIGSLLIILQQCSLSTGYSLQKIQELAGSIPSGDLFAHSSRSNGILFSQLSKSSDFDPYKLSIDFLKKAEGQSVLTRLSVLKTFLLAVLRSNKFYVNSDTLELAIVLIKLAISMDSKESEEAKVLVAGAQMYLSKVFTGFLIDYSLREEFFGRLESVYGEIQGAAEKQELFIKCYSYITECSFDQNRADFLAPILGGLNSQQSETSSKDILYAIERASHSTLLGLTKHVNKKLSEIEKTKENMDLITGYGIFLINFIVAKYRERGPIVNEAFRGIISHKKGAKTLKKRFNRFLSDFWKKSKMNVELSLNELPQDIKEVVDDYVMPYSYFS